MNHAVGNYVGELTVEQLLNIQSGFHKVYAHVNSSNEPVYNMQSYVDCVLGVHYKANCFNWEQVTEKLFGISIPSSTRNECYFNSPPLIQHMTKVFREGLRDDNYIMTHSEWLHRAKGFGVVIDYVYYIRSIEESEPNSEKLNKISLSNYIKAVEFVIYKKPVYTIQHNGSLKHSISISQIQNKVYKHLLMVWMKFLKIFKL